MKERFTDQAVVDGIRQKDPALLNRIMTFLYETHQPSITWLVVQNNSSLADAKDLFQDVLDVFLHKVWREQYQPRQTASLGTYLYEIARRLWQRELRRRKGHDRRADVFAQTFMDDVTLDTPEAQWLEAEEAEQARRIFGQLEPRDQAILEGFYRDRMSMQELADTLNLLNKENARTCKYRAIQALRKLMNYATNR